MLNVAGTDTFAYLVGESSSIDHSPTKYRGIHLVYWFEFLVESYLAKTIVLPLPIGEDFMILACIFLSVVVWCSGNVVGQINEVTLRQARLVLGWVTVYGGVNHLGM